MSRFHDDMKLSEAREVLRPLAEEGEHCPVCKQHVKVYKRKVHAGMALTLIRMWKAHGEEWQYLPALPQRSRDGTGLAWWDLIEEERFVKRPDGGRAGWWRVTSLGAQWAQNIGFIREYAHVYNGRVLKHSGDVRTIRDALGTKFDYTELMAA